jgi:hypothetical protein
MNILPNPTPVEFSQIQIALGVGDFGLDLAWTRRQ